MQSKAGGNNTAGFLITLLLQSCSCCHISKSSFVNLLNRMLKQLVRFPTSSVLRVY